MGFIQQGTAAAKKYEELIERDIKLAASYGDLTALALASINHYLLFNYT
jgi:hypothetical protein